MPTSRRRFGVRSVTSILAALFLVLVMSPTTAMAGPGPDPLTATSTTTTAVAPNATTPLGGVSVGGLTADDTIQVTVSTDRGSLAVGTTSGLVLGYGNNWSGDPSIAFSGSRTDVNAGLATLALSTGNDTGSTAHISITALPSAPGMIYSPTNQHFYEYVAATEINADDARTDALARTFLGQAGYLATIPTSTINDLIANRIEGAANVWFGARSIDTFDRNPARTWVWGDGPLANQPFTYCSDPGSGSFPGGPGGPGFPGGPGGFGGCDFANDAGLYHSWSPGEPNNSGVQYDLQTEQYLPYSGEWVAVTNYGSSIGVWNDLPPTFGSAGGYLVEYGDQVTGASSFPGLVTATSDVQVVELPATPTDISASPGDGQATVIFDPAAGSSPSTGYTVTSAPGGITKTCDASPCVVTGLTNGIEYTFTVVATNANGDSAPTPPSNPVTPATVPGAPTDFTVTTGDESGTATFVAPSDDGGAPVTSYTLTAQPGNLTMTCPDSPCVISGLTNGVAYTFSVHATNAAGDSVETSDYPGTPVGAPGKPTGVSAARGNGSATVTFTPPTDDGGNSIFRYRVTSAPGGITTTCPGSPCVVDGLTNGTEYQLTVVAINEIGVSDPSDPSAGVTPATVPGAPVNLVVDRGDQSAELSFIAPDDTGGAAITRYEVSLDGGDTWATLSTTGSAPITVTVSGLTNGTSYDIQVRAVNDIGPGLPGEPVGVTPARKPSAPTGVTAARGDERATVAFTAPADNGSPITAYTITSAPGGQAVSCALSPCVVNGLDNGTAYTFTVVATNDVGDSDPSAASDSVTPAGKPSAPVLQVVTSTAGALLLAFLEPVADGGSAIIGYQVSVDGGSTWQALTVTGTVPLEGTVTGLTNGTTYPVKVRAVNAVGNGTGSSTESGTPATVPTAPRSVTVQTGPGRATVNWTAPSSNGGSAITGYLVTASPGGQTCTNTTTSCTFASLPSGVSYTFSVVAVNFVDGRSGTGAGPAGVSQPTAVTDVPGVPLALAVTPGDRVLGLTFAPPASNGGSVITRYEVSTNGGATWATLTTKGSSSLSATVAPVLNGQPFAVQVRARNVNGSGPATATVAVTTLSWFADPVSVVDRAAEVAVPTSPAKYKGPLRHTTATYRSANATLAYPSKGLLGRQLQAGQAINLIALFGNGSSKLTKTGQADVKAAALSMRYVSQVTCEGYADYGGSVKKEYTLSKARATTVCNALKGYAKQVTSRKITAYGSTRPVVLSSKPSDRGDNRRVVVLIRG